MLNVVSNPLFQVIVLFIGTSGIWFVVTDESTEIKKNVLSFISDTLYYFTLTSFGLNLVISFREIISEPYRILLLSSEIYWLALILVMVYLTFKASKKKSLHY